MSNPTTTEPPEVTDAANTAETTTAVDLAELDIRSEEVQEIIGRPPHWLIRWGITAFFLVLILVLVSGWVIRYPEVIETPLTLSAINAPKTLESRVTGKLVRLIPENNTYVEEGQILAWMESTAGHQAVLGLSALVDSLQGWVLAGEDSRIRQVDLAGIGGLGDLQSNAQSFEQSLREYRSFMDGGIQQRQRAMLDQELAYTRQLLEMLEQQKQIRQEEYELARREFDIQQRLADQDLIAPIDLARAESELASRRLPLQQTESSIISNYLSQAAKEKEMMDLDRRIAEQESVFLQSLGILRSAIDSWMATYLLTAPIEGRVIYAGIIQENQSVQAGQQLFYIQPDDTDYTGQLQIPQESFGKVEEGQQVLIRMNGYPYQEYGTLEGYIDDISEVSMGEEGIFPGRVSFPDGFVTNYGRQLQPRDGMTGQAEIITQDMTLLQRVYNNMTSNLR